MVERQTTETLLERALAEIGAGRDDVSALVALHRRPTRTVFNAAAGMLDAPQADRRQLAARILRELGREGTGRMPFAGLAVPLLRRRLAVETDPGVLAWVISALGHNDATRAMPEVAAFARHPDAGVRLQVAASLPALVDADSVEEVASVALVALSTDSDADVRYSALVAIVEELPGFDPQQRRSAVAARLGDPDQQIKEFALASRDT